MERREAREHYHEVFQQFMTAYPRRIDQTQAFGQFLDLIEDGVEPQFLIERAQAYAHNVDPGELKYVPSPKNWLRDRRFEDTDLFQDRYVSTREWFMDKYTRCDAAAVCAKYGFIYTHPPIPDGVEDIAAWHRDQNRIWIGSVARHVLHGEPLPD